MPPYTCPGSLVLSRILTNHTQIRMPVQDPHASHTKPFATNPYAEAAFRQSQQVLKSFQAPNASQAKSLRLYSCPTIQIIAYARAASRQLQHFLCG
ncbi:hypothetical protein O181_124670 [Austropuccinia psidii MF-1]|uniref:Uncharacterized protein n=1 Tax=Austropuccinia psidii MF-1 TaxID=1389203 RepID=A0A9Q3KNC7_9BASI|nr:hypothetical protein [Austropuccinia psidii MF-1]